MDERTFKFKMVRMTIISALFAITTVTGSCMGEQVYADHMRAVVESQKTVQAQAEAEKAKADAEKAKEEAAKSMFDHMPASK